MAGVKQITLSSPQLSYKISPNFPALNFQDFLKRNTNFWCASNLFFEKNNKDLGYFFFVSKISHLKTCTRFRNCSLRCRRSSWIICSFNIFNFEKFSSTLGFLAQIKKSKKSKKNKEAAETKISEEKKPCETVDSAPTTESVKTPAENGQKMYIGKNLKQSLIAENAYISGLFSLINFPKRDNDDDDNGK